eukprot:Gb_30056 [translate_table: standard]
MHGSKKPTLEGKFDKLISIILEQFQ